MQGLLKLLCQPLCWCLPWEDQPSRSSIRNEPSSNTRPRPRVHGYGEFDTAPKRPERKYGYGEFDKPRNDSHIELQASSTRRSPRPQSTDRKNRIAYRRISAPPSPHSTRSNSTTRTSRTPPTVSDGEIDDPLLSEIVAALSEGLHHIPYAICGRAALLLHGNTDRLPRHVSFFVPSASKDVLRSWAASTPNFLLDPYRKDFLAVRTRDGELRRIRIKFLPARDFDRLRIAHPRVRCADGGEVRPPVIGLASLLDQVALGYWSNRRAYEASVRSMIAGDLFWVLGRVIGDGSGSGVGGERLSWGVCPNVGNPLFWDVFGAAYPEAEGLFRAAGLVVPKGDGVEFDASALGREEKSMNVDAWVRHSGGATSEWADISL